MFKKLAELQVNSFDDHHNEVVKALESAGFIVVLDHEIFPSTVCYIIAKGESKNE